MVTVEVACCVPVVAPEEGVELETDCELFEVTTGVLVDVEDVVCVVVAVVVPVFEVTTGVDEATGVEVVPEDGV